MGRNLEPKGTPVNPSSDKLIEFQQNGPGIASDLGPPKAVMRSEALDELVPSLDQPELGSTIEGVCFEAPTGPVVLDLDLKPQNKAPDEYVVRFSSEVLSAEAPNNASHCWRMAPCSDISHPVVNCSSKLAPVVAVDVPVDAGPKMAHCPIGNDRVEEDNAHLVNMPMINLCPQGDFGEDGMFPVPRVILDPTSSLLSLNPQLDDMPPADAESIESLALFSSPSPHAAPADQHGKASGSAQLALVFYQDRQLSSFAEVVRRGLGAAAEGLLGAGAVPISIRPITDVDRLEALGPKAASNMMEPLLGQKGRSDKMLLSATTERTRRSDRGTTLGRSANKERQKTERNTRFNVETLLEPKEKPREQRYNKSTM